MHLTTVVSFLLSFKLDILYLAFIRWLLRFGFNDFKFLSHNLLKRAYNRLRISHYFQLNKYDAHHV